MKKIILMICLLFGVNLYADLVEDAIKENAKGNDKKANELLDKACKSGNMEGCWALGLMYSVSGEKDAITKAKELYEKACDGGYMEGCHFLGDMYNTIDSGIEPDKAKAKALYEKACDGGYADACFVLGFMYDLGDGVQQDKAKAKAFYKKACDGGATFNACALYKRL